MITMRCLAGVARVTARERQLGVGGVGDHAVVGRIHGEGRLVHDVGVRARERADLDLVSGRELVDVVEGRAVSRAVTRDRGVADLARQRCPRVVPRALREVGELHALPDDPVDADLLDDDLADDPALRGATSYFGLKVVVVVGCGRPGLGVEVGTVTTGSSSCVWSSSLWN